MIKTVNTISELYAQVRDFDLIITNDAPLCTALNSLIDIPRLGPFAVTPHALARRFAPRLFNTPLQDAGPAILETARKLGKSLKQVHYHTERINTIRDHTGSLKTAETYISEGTDATGSQVLKYISSLPTIHNAMEQFDWDRSGLKNLKTAVIGPELFSALDRRVLPDQYTTIPLLMDTVPWDLPVFHTFDTEKDIVDRITDMVTPANANDIAVILNISSNYLSLLKARFESRGIPVRDTDNLADNLHVRAFSGLIDTALRSGDGLLIRDIMPLAGLCGAEIKSEIRNHALKAYASECTDPRFQAFHTMFSSIRQTTCGDLAAKLRELGWPLPDSLTEILVHLGLHSQKNTRSTWHELNYFLEHFETELSRCKRGVLFVNCRNAAFVNRPVCIFAGLDESWTRHAEHQSWIDTAAEEERHLQRFQVLLQQGEQRYFFSPLMRHNTPVIPCYYFNLLYERQVEGFHDSLFQGIPSFNKTPQTLKASIPTPIASKAEQISNLSPSSLNRFLLCPKLYAYSRLAEQEDQEYFLRGNLLHEFAAFYSAHPDTVEDKGLDFFIDTMVERYQVLAPSNIPALDHTVFNIAADNLKQFLNSKACQPVPGLDVIREERPDRNTFAALLKQPIDADHIECAFRDNIRHLKGVIDLAISSEHIIDYKTGRNKRSGLEIIRRALPMVRTDQVDIQPLLYLCAWRAFNPGPLTFEYYYCLFNHRDVIEQCARPEDNSITIHYKPCSFNEYLAREPEALGTGSKTRRDFMEKAGLQVFRDFFKENPLPPRAQFNRRILLADPIHAALDQAVTAALGKSNKTILGQVEGILKAAVALRTGLYKPHFFREDLDEFEMIVNESLDRINEGLKSRFSCVPLTPKTCRDCEAASFCLRDQA